MITLTNGFPQGPNGLIVPNGSVVFQLNVDATVVAAPGGFVSGAVEVVFQFDEAGQLIQPAKLWSNEELNPQNSVGLGTYYLVTFYDQNGARINQVPMWWQFPEVANATVDISMMIPVSTVGGNVIFYPTAFAVPVPTPTTLGGIFSNAGLASNWIRSINTDGTVSLSQPAASDLSNGVSGSGAVVLAASPTFTGTVNLPIATIGGKITSYNGLATEGNGVPSEPFQIVATNLSANYNAGGAKTIFTPTAATLIRVTVTTAIIVAATTGAGTSTLPSLTLGYTDEGGIARTIAMTATSATNTTAVFKTATELIYTDNSTPVTVTSASYASDTAAQMRYDLFVAVEIL